MDPEELSFEQLSSLGERPEIPDHYPPVLFGGNQWSAVEEVILADVEETQPIYPPRRPQFFEDLEVGYL